MIDIRPAITADDIDVVRTLFLEYAQSLGLDLGFQDFEKELATLPGAYGPPGGRLFIAWDGDGRAVGCVALRPHAENNACEMKRLYVRREGRGAGLGRMLAEFICEEARKAGYSRIYLDTMPTMTAAIALYRSLGFEPVEPYTFNPVPGAIFLARSLA